MERSGTCSCHGLRLIHPAANQGHVAATITLLRLQLTGGGSVLRKGTFRLCRFSMATMARTAAQRRLQGD